MLAPKCCGAPIHTLDIEMKRQPAKVLAPDDVRLLLAHADHRRHPLRDRVIVLLSFKAGLRACEIAGLDWAMLLRPDGKMDSAMYLGRGITKGGRGRRIPIHKQLKRALVVLHGAHGHARDGPVVQSERGGHMTAASIVNWFAYAYAQIGLPGCSSHSGRRTFITCAARVIAKTGGSLRDIQELAGHRSITTTERYIEGDRAAQRKLINLL
jgi:integrase/recombinase XerC